MPFTPELVVFSGVAACHAVAYLIALPRLPVKSAGSLRRATTVVDISILLIVGALYIGTNTSFTLVFFETWWWIYTIVVSAAIEVPLAILFCKKWGITWADLEKWD